ncbi:MAG: hypothetical protein QF405_02715 [Roseibacillus sp.]|jgi:hypothetical protein|nr:hypothetical protein [Roseibacillus sp.]MDP7106194.1 hypothetical protein [Roseibacillus sp.]MDP7306527.1 hypothetical protein [Roseibacillus sp.]MDP7496108.1 hypothetical protein [Roseibacillus sp.]HJM64290.1 hypothetical protein [Roseibacillus sp.]|tara:strand:- start:11650 stop:12231 length:582 start_codon:yes stop_codon:yes gene_type:complete
MVLRVLAAAFLLPALCSAVTVEVVNLYQPLSLHNTDGIGEDLGENDPIQAAVMSRPCAVGGAMPEDLVKAVATPHRIASDGQAYDVKDANLLNLCKITLSAEMKKTRLLVRLDVSKFELPEELDLTVRQVVALSILAIERTLKDYFRNNKNEALGVSIGVKGTNEGNETLKDLAKRFNLGGSRPAGEEGEDDL